MKRDIIKVNPYAFQLFHRVQYYLVKGVTLLVKNLTSIGTQQISSYVFDVIRGLVKMTIYFV